MRDLAFGPSGTTLAAACGDGVRLIDILSGEEITHRGVAARGAGRVELSPDGRFCAALWQDGTVDLETLGTRNVVCAPLNQIEYQVGFGKITAQHRFSRDSI